MMNESELIDLGSVSEETHGHVLVGPEDVSTGMRQFNGGICSDD